MDVVVVPGLGDLGYCDDVDGGILDRVQSEVNHHHDEVVDENGLLHASSHQQVVEEEEGDCENVAKQPVVKAGIKRRRVYTEVEKALVINAQLTGGRKERLKIASLLGMPLRTSDTIVTRYRKDPGEGNKDDRKKKKGTPELMKYCRQLLEEDKEMTNKQMRIRLNKYILARVVQDLGLSDLLMSPEDETLSEFLQCKPVADEYKKREVRSDKTVAEMIYELTEARRGWKRGLNKGGGGGKSEKWSSSATPKTVGECSQSVSAVSSGDQCRLCGQKKGARFNSEFVQMVHDKIHIAEEKVARAEQVLKQEEEKLLKAHGGFQSLLDHWPSEWSDLLVHLESCEQAINLKDGRAQEHAQMNIDTIACTAGPLRLVVDWRKQRELVLHCEHALSHAKRQLIAEKGILESAWSFGAELQRRRNEFSR